MGRNILLLLLSLVLAFYLPECFSREFQVSQKSCSNRFEYRLALAERFQGCQHLVKYNPMCGENIKVAYGNIPPYVFWNHHESRVDGILPAMLKNALDVCCFGCNNVTYLGPFGHIDRFFQDDVNVSMPVFTSSGSSTFFDHNYINMLEVQKVQMLGRPLKHDPTKMGKVMISTIFGTWPLFFTAFLMAATAGVAVWILDTKFNQSEFPITFPRGPFEGFWWAFVSMTTVGYGDRSPKSTMARLFAVVWILVGITVFSMYTASLSSALTSATLAAHDTSVYQKRIGILNTSSVGYIATIKTNSYAVSFETLDQITEALKQNTIEGVGLDDNVAQYFAQELYEKSSLDLVMYDSVEISGCSYGMVVYSDEISHLLKTFFQNNNDQRTIMAKKALTEISSNYPVQKSIGNPEGNVFFSATSPLFLLTIISLLSIAAVSTAFGLLMKWCSAKHWGNDKTNNDGSLLRKRKCDNSSIITAIEDMHEQLNIIKDQLNEKSTNGKIEHAIEP